MMAKMTSLMHCMRSSARKTSGTKFALEGFFSSMNIIVLFKFLICVETFAANFTSIFLLIIGSVFSLYMSIHKHFTYKLTALNTRNFLVRCFDMLFQVFNATFFFRTMRAFMFLCTMNISEMSFQICHIFSAFWAQFILFCFLIFLWIVPIFFGLFWYL